MPLQLPPLSRANINAGNSRVPRQRVSLRQNDRRHPVAVARRWSMNSNSGFQINEP